jgi:hypothetical protein
MSNRWPEPGLNFTPEYQRSGTPYVTASNGAEVNSTTPTKIAFPRVTRWIEITPFTNSGAGYLKVGFTSNGVLSRGAVTGSYFREYDEDGDVKFSTTSPAPNAFEQSATARNYLIIPAASTTPSVRLELACTDLFFLTDASTCGFSVVAGLTNIPSTDLILSGANGNYGVG